MLEHEYKRPKRDCKVITAVVDRPLALDSIDVMCCLPLSTNQAKLEKQLYHHIW
jgi:hypothetical protein